MPLKGIFNALKSFPKYLYALLLYPQYESFPKAVRPNSIIIKSVIKNLVQFNGFEIISVNKFCVTGMVIEGA